MKDLKARLASLAGQLREMEQELSREAQRGTVRFSPPDELALKDFKDTIDRLRHVIWPYVEAAAARTDDIDTTLQRYRMERVTDMLENLKDRVETPDLDDAPEVRSFFSNIQRIATTAVEKHLERLTKPAAKAPMPQDFALPKRLAN